MYLPGREFPAELEFDRLLLEAGGNDGYTVCTGTAAGKNGLFSEHRTSRNAASFHRFFVSRKGMLYPEEEGRAAGVVFSNMYHRYHS